MTVNQLVVGSIPTAGAIIEDKMWVLLVISYISEYNDYKVTEFNRYANQNQCIINQTVLESTFKDNEKAVCIKGL